MRRVIERKPDLAVCSTSFARSPLHLVQTMPRSAQIMFHKEILCATALTEQKCLRRSGFCGQQMLKTNEITRSTCARALHIAKCGEDSA
jgi:hypothetical protein